MKKFLAEELNLTLSDEKTKITHTSECADFLGIKGRTKEDKFNNFIDAIEELKDKVGIKKTIKDYGIEEADFLATLDEMVENAFDDQCTGANPRYPLMSEIKEMYLKAYYGE